jgi:DNA-directed RNA polymerase subunit H (RpoH/RPB5)
MAQSSGTITTIFKSRQTLLKLLQAQKYDISDYEEFSVNEVHIMYNNKQLDMLMSSDGSDSTKKKVYIKYHLAKTLPRQNINDYIDDLYNLEQVLSKGDTLIIVIKQEPNDPLLNILRQIWEQDGIFIIVYNLERLQFNILEHSYVPKHVIMNETEIVEMKKIYNIKDDIEIPEISRFDPVAVAIGMRPGNICKIVRPSKTAITTNYYRLCSQ